MDPNFINSPASACLATPITKDTNSQVVAAMNDDSDDDLVITWASPVVVKKEKDEMPRLYGHEMPYILTENGVNNRYANLFSITLKMIIIYFFYPVYNMKLAGLLVCITNQITCP
jgi:hypothetical protein